MILKKGNTDTLTIEMISNQPEKVNKILQFVKLNDNEKGVLDYDNEEWRNNDSLQNQYEADRWRRFEEYLIAIGETTREELDLEKADSSHYITLPVPPVIDEK